MRASDRARGRVENLRAEESIVERGGQKAESTVSALHGRVEKVRSEQCTAKNTEQSTWIALQVRAGE